MLSKTRSCFGSKLYGEKRYVIYNGEVIHAFITGVKENVRGVVSEYQFASVEKFEDEISLTKRKVFDAPKKHIFTDEEKAKKALFRMKLKGEA